MPFIIIISEGFKEGQTIHVVGKIKEHPKRFLAFFICILYNKWVWIILLYEHEFKTYYTIWYSQELKKQSKKNCAFFKELISTSTTPMSKVTDPCLYPCR